MKTFKVTITEILKREIYVEAEDHREAERIVEEQYYHGDHVLGSGGSSMMEQCAKCNKEFETKDLFLQWFTLGETYVCEDCIRKHKQYQIDCCYSPDSDITFIFAMARIPVADEFIELSQSLIGYLYGEYTANDSNVKLVLQDWLTNNPEIRKDWLRQNFNENNKNKEVLY